MERDKIKNDLLNADFTEVQSETQSYLFAQLATKDDLRELRSEMHSEFRVVRGEMKTMEANLLTAMEKMAGTLRAEIAQSAEDTMKTIAGFQNKLFMMTLALIGALATIFTALQLFFSR